MERGGEALLQARGLEVRRGGALVVAALDLELWPGEVVALLGPNGAGKSSLLAALAGALPATGSVQVVGTEANARRRRRQVGYLPERPPLYPEMTPVGHLRFCARLYGLRGAGARAAAAAALERCGLAPVAQRCAGRLSLGQQRRLGIAMALVHEPPLLLLDEPTAGLDPRQVEGLLELLAGLGGERGVLLSSHVLAEVQRSCQRLLVLAQGRLVYQAPVRRPEGEGEVALRLGVPVSRAALEAVSGVRVREALGGGRWLLSLEDEAAAERLLAAVLEGGWQLLEWLPPELDLERRYLSVTAPGAC